MELIVKYLGEGRSYLQHEEKQYLTWSEFMKMSPKDKEKVIKLFQKENKFIKEPDSVQGRLAQKDPSSAKMFQKSAGVGKSMYKYKSPDGSLELVLVGGPNIQNAPKTVWRIYSNNTGQYFGASFKNLKKGQEGLWQNMMRKADGQIKNPFYAGNIK